MKTAILLFVVLFLTYTGSNGQAIPNASFENWSFIDQMYLNPDGWVTNGSDISIRVDYETPGQTGNLALKLRGTGFARTKFHFSQYPFTIGAYVKSNIVPNDSVRIQVFVYSGNSIETTGDWINSTSIPSWSPISISVTDSLMAVPDSVEILITSSNLHATILSIDNMSISPITGIEENSIAGNVTVFPNPFTESISIAADNIVSLHFTLYDVTGKMVLEQENVQNSKIPVQHIPRGIYIYEVRDKVGAAKRGKLVKN